MNRSTFLRRLGYVVGAPFALALSLSACNVSTAPRFPEDEKDDEDEDGEKEG